MSGNEVLAKFLEQGGSGRDFVAVLNQDVKVKTSDVVVVFAALESILHNVAKKSVELESTDAAAIKKFQQLALDITRNILEDHVRYFSFLQVKFSVTILSALMFGTQYLVNIFLVKIRPSLEVIKPNNMPTL